MCPIPIDNFLICAFTIMATVARAHSAKALHALRHNADAFVSAFLRLTESERRELYSTAMPCTFLMRVSEADDRFATADVLDVIFTMLWERKELRVVVNGLDACVMWLSRVGKSKDKRLRFKVCCIRALLFVG